MRLNIRTKLISAIILGLVLIISFALYLGYFRGIALLRNTISSDYEKIAGVLASSVSQMIDATIDDRKDDSTRLLWRNDIKKHNLQYAGMDGAALQKHFSDMDKQWLESPAESAFIRNYLDNNSSRMLTEVAREKPEIAEIFITDKIGGLIAASGKTSDFYQADEEWWQKAYNQGKGDIYIGTVEYDRSSDRWSIPMAAPLRDETGQVIGVLKFIIDIDKLLSPLDTFFIGKSGHPMVIDNNNNLLYHPGILPMTKLSDIVPVLAGKTRETTSRVIFSPFHKKNVFVSAAHPLTGYAKNKLLWQVMVVQDEQEIFAPLRNLVWQFITLSVILALLIPPIAFILVSAFVRPINKLTSATKEIASGNLNYKLTLKTGDELESLAESFNRMSDALKTTLVSKDYLNSIMENMLEPLVVTTPDKKITSVNEAVHDLLGYGTEELYGKDISLIIPEEKTPHDNGTMETQSPQGKHSWKNLEVYCRAKNGTSIPVLLSCSTVKDKNNTALYRIYTIKDITNRKNYEKNLQESYTQLAKAQSQLLHASKMSAMGQLAGGVAHEINNPLTGVINNVQLIKMIANQKKEPSPEEFRALLDSIEQAALRCKKITQSLLDISSPAEGSAELISPNALLEKILLLIEQEMALNNITVKTSFHPNLYRIRGNPQLMEQVILNLLANAKWAVLKKHQRGGGIIIVTTWQETSTKNVFLSVTDNGIGIAQEDIIKIFEPFFTTKDIGEGTGLGLALSYNIIKNLNGSISVKSIMNDETTFTISIPYVTPDETGQNV